jgi:hypothetical protein
MKLSDMDHAQFALLFAVRRSMRYHDRRRAFFERLHRVTNVLTILMAGSVLHQLGQDGEAAVWLVGLSVAAALMAAVDMVLGYSSRAALHRELKVRFAELEIAMLSGNDAPETWVAHQVERLKIERDEPPIYHALDLLCHNETAAAEGIKRSERPQDFETLTPWQRMTSHLFMWSDIGAR